MLINNVHNSQDLGAKFLEANLWYTTIFTEPFGKKIAQVIGQMLKDIYKITLHMSMGGWICSSLENRDIYSC